MFSVWQASFLTIIYSRIKKKKEKLRMFGTFCKESYQCDYNRNFKCNNNVCSCDVDKYYDYEKNICGRVIIEKY